MRSDDTIESAHPGDAPRRPPLSGLQLLDFSHLMAGPYASMMLADYGVDVIKVERPAGGDGSRSMGSHYIDGVSTMYLTWNRGKRSLAVDVKTDKGKEIIHRLIESSDALLENFRPGAMDRLGLGFDEVHAINPQLVYCSVSAFGSDGPYAQKPGTDPLIQAMSGTMHVTGERGGPPLLVGVPVADFTGSLLAAQGLLLGLLATRIRPEGMHVKISMLDGLIFGLTTRVGPYLYHDEEAERLGAAHSQLAPYQSFETRDGYLMTGVWHDKDWRVWCEAVGCTELIDDPRFENNRRRVENRDALVNHVGPLFKTATTEEWLDRLADENVLVAPVHSLHSVFEDPQVRHNGTRSSVEHPSLGSVDQIANPIRIEGMSTMSRRHPPALGEHSRTVLEELGYPDDLINQMLADGTVAERPHPERQERTTRDVASL